MKDFVKSESKCALSDYMDDTFANIHKQDAEFGEALKKWKYLFVNTIYKVAKVREAAPLDVFHELMVPLVKLNELHKLQLYRYKKKVYEIDRKDGPYVRLVAQRYNLRKITPVWMPEEHLEPIKQASISSLVYRKIQQESSVMFRSVFTGKNGYKVVSENSGWAKMRNVEYGKKFQIIKKNEVIKLYSNVSLDDRVNHEDDLTIKDMLADSASFSSEDLFSMNELSAKLMDRLSPPAQQLFEELCSNPGASERALIRKVALNKKTLHFAQREIVQNYLYLTEPKPKSTCAPYVIYNGDYYYLVDEDGDYLIIRAGRQPRYVHRSRVKIEYEMAYRTPVHLRASMVA